MIFFEIGQISFFFEKLEGCLFLNWPLQILKTAEGIFNRKLNFAILLKVLQLCKMILFSWRNINCSVSIKTILKSNKRKLTVIFHRLYKKSLNEIVTKVCTLNEAKLKHVNLKTNFLTSGEFCKYHLDINRVTAQCHYSERKNLNAMHTITSLNKK